MMEAHVSEGETSQYCLQLVDMPVCVGREPMVVVVKGFVRVVGVPGIPTQYQEFPLIPEQSWNTLGFHLMKSALYDARG